MKPRPAADVVALSSRFPDPWPFSVTPRRVARELVLEAYGELDLATGPELERSCATALMEEGALDSVTLDLSRVSFVDLAGVRAIQSCSGMARAHGTAFKVRGARAQAVRLVQLCGDTDLLD